MPIYLAFIYFLHPLLGALTLAGAFVLTVLTVLSEILTRRLHASTRRRRSPATRSPIPTPATPTSSRPWDLPDRAVDRFTEANSEHLELQTGPTTSAARFAAISRVLRMMLQSAVLGLGAYLTIKGELSAGAIIACSVASARALAPVDLAIGNWKAFVAARMAFRRLRETVMALAAAEQPMKLPAPSKSLSVEKITVAAPGSGQVLLSDISFELKRGPGARHHRPQRRRQDDDGACPDRHLAAAARQCPARRRRTRRSGARTRSGSTSAICRRRSA